MSHNEELMCLNCGYENSMRDKFCSACGHPLIDYNSEQSLSEVDRNGDDLDENAELDTTERHPWSRFFARLVDYFWYGLIIQFLAFFTLPTGNSIIRVLIYTITLTITWIPIESLWLTKFGKTPGKWLFNISVCNETGERLELGPAFKRSVQVALYGCAFGFPILSQLATIGAYGQLLQKGKSKEAR